MAFYSRVKLPPLKLSVRSASATCRTMLFRGSTEPSSINVAEDKVEENDQEEEADLTLDDLSDEACEPTHHELHCKASVKGWAEHRKKLLSVLTESAAMPLGQLCALCPNNALYRCQECGPLVFYCQECFRTQHKSVNYFYIAEKWEVYKCVSLFLDTDVFHSCRVIILMFVLWRI